MTDRANFSRKALLLSIICLLLIILIVGGCFYFQRKKSLKSNTSNISNTSITNPKYVIATRDWAEYKSDDASFSFKFPKKLTVTVEPSFSSTTLLALSSKANYNFSQDTCTAAYILTTTETNVRFDEFGDQVTKAYADKSQISQQPISGHNTYILNGTSADNTLGSIFAPTGSNVDFALLDTGNFTVTLSTCGATPDKSEFEEIVSTFSLPAK